MPAGLTQLFSPNLRHKGIEIQAPKGTSVFAAQAGEVVYRGTGIKGYGHLVILRHQAGLLTAYAFTQHILVKEGQWVKANQKILKR